MNTQASSVATTVTLVTTCFTHSVQRTHARGNQHARTEYGKCAYCGKPHRRRISWDKKDARSWWEPTP